MKIIFLDIDGVLNCRKTFINHHEEKIKINRLIRQLCHQKKITFENAISICDQEILYLWLKSKMLEIEVNKIALLKKIVLETNAKVVVTSSWKILDIYPYVEKELIKRGIPIIGATPNLGKRGLEIRDYLKSHPEINDFIILDDTLFSDFYELENNLVKTNFYKDGLDEKNVSQVIKKLKKM